MKISLDLRLADLPGGANVYVAKLIPALLALKENVQWQFYHNPKSKIQRQIIEHAVQAAGIADSQKLPDNIELRSIRSRCLSLSQHIEFILAKHCCDLYHYLHFDMPLGLGKTPLVITIHDLYPISIKGYCHPAKSRYFYHLTKHNCRRAAAIIAISQYTKNEIIELLDIPAEKIHVIPQSHSARFRPISYGQMLQAAKEKYKLPQQFIFYTGNHKPHKNIDRLIQAYARLPRQLRDEFPMLLTGKIGPDTQSLLARIEQLNLNNSVRFLGWVEDADLPAIYNLASLAALPSLYEGFGLSPLEAMACGTAAVCSNTTAIHEVVAGLARQFDPTNIEQITAALEQSLTRDISNPNLKSQYIQHAAKFSEQKTAKMTFALYKQILDA